MRFRFKNGTDDAGFKTYPMLLPGMPEPGDVPLSTFLRVLEPVAVNTTLEWCKACNNTVDRGCAALFACDGSGSSVPVIAAAHYEQTSPIGAGFPGVGLAAAVLLTVLAALFFSGFVTIGRPRKTSGSQRDLQSSVRVLVKSLWIELILSFHSLAKPHQC